MYRAVASAVGIVCVASAVGCSAQPAPSAPSTATTSVTSITPVTSAATPQLRSAVEQFVADANQTIGKDQTAHIQKWATPDCAPVVLAFGSINRTTTPSRVVSVAQDGQMGTSVTALTTDPDSAGETLHWAYSDRWRFTCQDIFKVS